jgi:hypothetical protein
MMIDCLDSDGDGDLDPDDGAWLQGADFRIPLRPGACDEPGQHAEYFASTALDASVCESGGSAALIVAVAGGGGDLMLAQAGDSTGLVDIVDAARARLASLGTAAEVVLSTSAIFRADLPQTRMEQWLSLQVSRRLEAVPCMRAVLMGHSHGGVTVGSVTAALDARFSDRMFGVLLDRTDKLYDRTTDLMPALTPILNVYQLNEGWHGAPIGQANVTNVDVSDAVAPSDPDRPGSPSARVTHPTMDYAPAVQSVVVDAAVASLSGDR